MRDEVFLSGKEIRSRVVIEDALVKPGVIGRCLRGTGVKEVCESTPPKVPASDPFNSTFLRGRPRDSRQLGGHGKAEPVALTVGLFPGLPLNCVYNLPLNFHTNSRQRDDGREVGFPLTVSLVVSDRCPFDSFVFNNGSGRGFTFFFSF